MSIPNLDNVLPQRERYEIFTVNEFKGTYVKALAEWYQKDDKGNKQAKPRLSVLNGYSYDKMCSEVYKVAAKETKGNELLSKKFIESIVKILKKYKGKNSRNKLIYVTEVMRSLEATDGYIENMVRSKVNVDPSKYSKRTMNVCMQVYEKHLYCPQIKVIYEKFEKEMANPERKNETIGSPPSGLK